MTDNNKDFKNLLKNINFYSIPGLKETHITLLSKIRDSLINNNALYDPGWITDTNYNISTGKAYEIFNSILLKISKEKNSYNSNGWLTFKQMKELNKKLKLVGENEIKLTKGSKGTKIIFTSIYNKKEKKNITQKELNDMDPEKRTQLFKNNEIYFYHKEATVFNLDDFKNIPKSLILEKTIEKIDVDYELADMISNEMGINLKYDKDGVACYFPKLDLIMLPEKKLWKDNNSFKATFFHELAHATGHKDRLNRNFMKKNKLAYSLEEIIAETSSIFLSKNFDYSTDSIINSSADYIEGYANILINNPKLIISSISEASKVSEYILNNYINAIERTSNMEVENNKLFNDLKIEIIDYCNREYDSKYDIKNFNEIFPDIEHIPIAYTTTPDEKHEIQYEINLKNLSWSQYVNDKLVDTHSYLENETLSNAIKIMIMDFEYGDFSGFIDIDLDKLMEIGLYEDDEGNFKEIKKERKLDKNINEL